MKPWLIVLVVAVCAVAWWNLRDSGGSEDASSESSSIIAVPADDTADRTTITSDPFAVVEDEPQTRETTVQDEPASKTPVNDNNAVLPQQEAQSTQRSVVRVEVPDSYPVTEAGKYFIPKDEREPGRLGGPPPLNFPGGPSDPSRQSDQGLQPPVAPGQ